MKTEPMNRRTVDFKSAKEVMDDILCLRADGYDRVGNWNLTQMCQHLTETMNGGIDGFGFRAPWIFRATLIKWIFHYSLRKRRLISGAPTINALKPTHTGSAEDDAAIEACLEACRRADAYDGSMEDYALLDDLSVDQWREFMWLHASHHLSFLIPRSKYADPAEN